MKDETSNLLITLKFQEPTPKQRSQEKYLMRARDIQQQADSLRTALLSKIEDKFDMSTLNQKVEIIIRYSRTGSHKIDFSSIQDRRIRVALKRYIDGLFPMAF